MSGAAGARSVGASLGARQLDQPGSEQEVQRQLAALDDAVDSYTLDEQTPDDQGLEQPAEASRREESLHPGGRPLQVSANGSRAESGELRARAGRSLPSAEQTRLIIRDLNSEKRNLQRLVIAQKASLQAERDQHIKTRKVAVEAIDRLKRSRLEQMRAEKTPRRERAQRMKLEGELDSMNRNLLNAHSTLREGTRVLDEADA